MDPISAFIILGNIVFNEKCILIFRISGCWVSCINHRMFRSSLQILPSQCKSVWFVVCFLYRPENDHRVFHSITRLSNECCYKVISQEDVFFSTLMMISSSKISVIIRWGIAVPFASRNSRK